MFGLSAEEKLEKAIKSAKLNKLGWISASDVDGVKKPNIPDRITIQDGDVFEVLASDYNKFSPIYMAKGNSLQLTYEGSFMNAETREMEVHDKTKLHAIEVDDNVVINGACIFTARSVKTQQRMLGALLTEKMD